MVINTPPNAPKKCDQKFIFGITKLIIKRIEYRNPNSHKYLPFFMTNTIVAPINPKIAPDAPKLIEYIGNNSKDKRFPIIPDTKYITIY